MLRHSLNCRCSKKKNDKCIINIDRTVLFHKNCVITVKL